jgi:hypothetical protein
MNLFSRLLFVSFIVSVSGFSQNTDSSASKSASSGLRKIDGHSINEVIEAAMSNVALNIEPIDIDIPAIDIQINGIDFDIPNISINIEPFDINIPEIDIDPIEIDLNHIDIDPDDFHWNKGGGNDDEENDAKAKGLKKIN